MIAGFGFATMAQFIFTSCLAVHLVSRGFSPSVIALISIVFQIGLRGLGPLTSFLISRFGVKRVFAATSACMVMGYLGAASSNSALTFGAFCALLGAGLGIDAIIRLTLLLRMSQSRNDDQKLLSLNYIVFNAAAAVGPLLASTAMHFGVSSSSLFYVSALLMGFVSILFFAYFPFPKRHHMSALTLKDFKQALSAKEVLNSVLLLSGVYALFFLMHSMVPVYLLTILSISKSTVTLMFALNALIVVALGYPLTAFINATLNRLKLSRWWAVSFGTLLMGTGIFCLTLSSVLGTHAIFLFMTLFSLGEIFFAPISQVIISELIPSGEREKAPIYLGVGSLSMAMGALMSNSVGSALIELSTHRPSVFPVGLFSLSIALSGLYAFKAAASLKAIVITRRVFCRDFQKPSLSFAETADARSLRMSRQDPLSPSVLKMER
jgi:MFS family permease